MERSIERVPTWALPYMANGDATGLKDKGLTTYCVIGVSNWYAPLQTACKAVCHLIIPKTHYSARQPKWKIVSFFIISN
jgi:hypothetical protein